MLYFFFAFYRAAMWFASQKKKRVPEQTFPSDIRLPAQLCFNGKNTTSCRYAKQYNTLSAADNRNIIRNIPLGLIFQRKVAPILICVRTLNVLF